MKNEFLNYKEALALKELGFDESCFGYFVRNTFIKWSDDSTSPKKCTNTFLKTHNPTWLGEVVEDEKSSAPLFQQAFRWFRVKYKLFGKVFLVVHERKYAWQIDSDISYESIGKPIHDTYEEAEQACLEKLIEIITKK